MTKGGLQLLVDRGVGSVLVGGDDDEYSVFVFVEFVLAGLW